MRIIKLQKISVDEIVTVLKSGGLVVLPTETLYGAMVDATNPKAVKKLTAYKNRPFGKPYSIAVTSMQMAEKYVFLNATAKNLYNTFLPGPLTVVSKGKHTVAPGVESEDGTLGIRIPDYKLVIDVSRKLGGPITATSANASYKKRPYKISDILENISEKQKKLIDLIVDAGKLPTREPSTVIDTTLDDPVILRVGDIKLKDKMEVLSRSEENTKNVAKDIFQKYERFMGKRAVVFALIGEMGTGKTIFTKGLAKAMNIDEIVTSPTFSLMNEYSALSTTYNLPSTNLTHIDTWRMVGSSEIMDIGFEKLINEKAFVAIEWADRVVDIIREFEEHAIIVWVKITYGKNKDDRLISWGSL